MLAKACPTNCMPKTYLGNTASMLPCKCLSFFLVNQGCHMITECHTLQKCFQCVKPRKAF